MNMLDTILFGFICLFAVYGALTILLGIAEDIKTRPIGKKDNIRVVLLVKNAGDYVEEVVRSAFRQDFTGKALSACNLAVVDLGSTDDTVKILEKLCLEYQYVDVYTYDEKDKVFCGLS